MVESLKTKYTYIFLFILITNCHQIEKKKTITSHVIPTSESLLIKIFAYDKSNKLKTIITGKKHIIFRNSQEIWLDNIKIIHIYTEDNKTSYVQLTADKGKVNYKTYHSEAWQNAVIIRDKEIRIETERVYWNHDERKFYTKDEERVIIYKRQYLNNPNDNTIIKTVGKNLIANENLKTIQLEKSITSSPKKLIDE